jgi:hypothetical protein
VSDHEHRWQPNGLVRTNGCTPSPCSRWDDMIYTRVHSILICECGAHTSKHVANENVRRRGDDLRRAAA